jgi:hypothetical protein
MAVSRAVPSGWFDAWVVHCSNASLAWAQADWPADSAAVPLIASRHAL